MDRRRWVRLAVVCGLAFVVLTIPILLHQDWPGEWEMVQWALGG